MKGVARCDVTCSVYQRSLYIEEAYREDSCITCNVNELIAWVRKHGNSFGLLAALPIADVVNVQAAGKGCGIIYRYKTTLSAAVFCKGQVHNNAHRLYGVGF